MKTIRYALIALLLMALLAVPAFAEPEGDTDATVPVQTVAPNDSDQEDSTDVDGIQPVDVPDVTFGIVAINETLDDESLEKEPRDDLLGFESAKPTPLEYIEANAIPFAALAAAGLALLFSVIALAKSKKQSGRRKMKNYF